MSHQIVSTEGFVLSSRGSGESSRVYRIFTRDLGLVSALAKSVMEETGKLRYGLQDYAKVRVSLVRGKEIWRITGVELLSPMGELAPDKLRRDLYARQLSLLARVIHGEHDDWDLYDQFALGVSHLASCDVNELASLEVLLAVGLLSHSGHLDKSSEGLSIVEADYKEALSLASERRSELVGLVNKSLREGGLI